MSWLPGLGGKSAWLGVMHIQVALWGAHVVVHRHPTLPRAVALYCWTLAAPVLFPDRDFS